MNQLNELSRSARDGRNATILAFLIFLIYASLRWLAYDLYPVEDFADWVVRDTFMDFPRLLVLALSLWLGLRLWSTEALGLHFRGWREATWVFVVFFLLLWLPDAWVRTTPHGLSASTLTLLTASSVLVGCWEELLFRGVFFNAIREWKGAKAAAWGSSVLFTVMHIQAQPLYGWPAIFLCGMLFALLRLRGVGLLWLMAYHGLFDALVFFGPTGPSQIVVLPFALLLVRAVFVSKYYRASQPWLVRDPGPSERHEEPSEEKALEIDPSPLPAPSYERPTESEEQRRFRELVLAANDALNRPDSYRIRIHITLVDASGNERDLGPWPDPIARASRLEDATDLCSMLSHHIRAVLFRNSHFS